MKIYCCGCNEYINARLTDGKEIYTHRPDLYKLPFWKCDRCGNFVGCHHKTNNRTNPLGCIPTYDIREARKKIHYVLDPLWKEGSIARGRLYKIISDELGYQFHTAEIKSVEEGEKIYNIVKKIKERPAVAPDQNPAILAAS